MKAQNDTSKTTEQPDEISFVQAPLPMGNDDDGAMEIEPSTQASAPGGLNDFSYVPEASEISLPYIRLAQGLSPEVTEGTAKPGQWILPDGSLSDHVTGTVIGMRRTRVYRTNDEIACRSDDAVVGRGTPGGDCANCPLQQWTKNGDKSVPPACTMNFQYLLGYQDADGNEAGIGVVNMSSKSASKVASQINLNMRLHGPNGFKITLGSQKIAKGARTYQVPTLTNVKMLTKQLNG